MPRARLGHPRPWRAVLKGSCRRRTRSGLRYRRASRDGAKCATWARSHTRRSSASCLLPTSSSCRRMGRVSPPCSWRQGQSGLPVIASAVGGIPELLGEDRGRLLPAISVGQSRPRFVVPGPPSGGRVAAERLQHVVSVSTTCTNARRLRERTTESAERERDDRHDGHAATTPAEPALRVAMVLYGDITFDSRVQREANALVAAGHRSRSSAWGIARDGVDAGPPGRVHWSRRRAALVARQGQSVRHGRARVATPRDSAFLATYAQNLRTWGRGIARRSGRFDVWHAHDFTGLVAASMARRPGDALVYDMHDCSSTPARAPAFPARLRRFSCWYERRLCATSDLVVTVNHGPGRLACGSTSVAVDRGGPQLCPANHAARAAADPHPRCHRPRSERRASCCTTGCSDADRGLEHAVPGDAEPGLERAHLVLLGFGPDRERLQAAGRRTTIRRAGSTCSIRSRPAN